MSLLEKHISKKFLFFYIAHELMFNTMNMQLPAGNCQTLNGADIGQSNHQLLKVDKEAYVKAVGDNLDAWCAYLCLELGESDYFRLNKILNLFNSWQQYGIFKKSFIDYIRRIVLPQFEIAKDAHDKYSFAGAGAQQVGMDAGV